MTPRDTAGSSTSRYRSERHESERGLNPDPHGQRLRTWALAQANGTTLVGRQWQGPWAVVEGDRLVELPTGTTTPVGVILSDDGSLAAWVNDVDRTTQRVVLWDLVAGEEVDRVEVVVSSAFLGDLSLNGIDRDSRVTWTTNALEDPTLWRPGSEPVPITGLPGVVQQSTAIGLIAGGALGEVDDQGRFSALQMVEPRTLWSPDGTVQIRVGPGTQVTVNDIGTRVVTELPGLGLPSRRSRQGPGSRRPRSGWSARCR